MALALAESIVAGWDTQRPGAPLRSLVAESEYSVDGDCFDIGFTTRRALSLFERNGDARTSGDPSEQASGNGSIMRLAPVPICYAGLFPDDLKGWSDTS